MKVIVDKSRCSSIGLCEAAASDIFEIGPDGALHILMDDVPESRRLDLEQACENCPTQALSIED